ncbi:MAG: hypothetical protein ACO1OD_02265 [Croceibacterium sp.]
MKPILALASLALLSGCVVYKNAPIVDNGPPAVEGTAVPLRQPVQVGAVVATPISVVEDSRCPENARCVWAGRLIVSTRIDGAGWRETADLTLGEPKQVRDVTIALVSGLPEKQAERETPPSEYRFVYEAR